jgi:hypothetical protein
MELVTHMKLKGARLMPWERAQSLRERKDLLSSIPCATASWHRIGSSTSGVDAARNAGMHDARG